MGIMMIWEYLNKDGMGIFMETVRENLMGMGIILFTVLLSRWQMQTWCCSWSEPSVKELNVWVTRGVKKCEKKTNHQTRERTCQSEFVLDQHHVWRALYCSHCRQWVDSDLESPPLHKLTSSTHAQVTYSTHSIHTWQQQIATVTTVINRQLKVASCTIAADVKHFHPCNIHRVARSPEKKNRTPFLSPALPFPSVPSSPPSPLTPP